MKQGFEDRIQKPTHHFLSDSITNTGNTERSLLVGAGAFTNVDPTQREWSERAGFHLPHQRVQVFFAVGIKHVDAHLVDSRSASISSHRLEGLSHQFGSNPPGERMGLDFLLHGVPLMPNNHGVPTTALLGDVS